MPSIAIAHDITISGTTTFAALDGSSADHDGVANGVFTVNDGNLIIAGTVNCNDDSGSDSACSMAFNASGDIVVNGALYAENRTGGGTGGSISLMAGRDLVLNPGAIVSSSSKSSSGATGGNITASVARNVSLAAGSTIDAGSANARGGTISLSAGGTVLLDGNVLSGPSRTILATRLTGTVLDGGTANQIGGEIHVSSTTFAFPAVTVGSNANLISQGEANGSGPVTIQGCGVTVDGLVAALARKDAAANVSIRSGKGITVDARDLGVTGATSGRLGRIRADAPSGTAVNHVLELLAAEAVDVLGPAPASSSAFTLSALSGVNDSKSVGGHIRIISTGGTVSISGNAADDGRSSSGDTGGPIEILARGDVDLDAAVIRSFGDSSTNNPARGGGSITVRSYSGGVSWVNGSGDVRPTGSASGLTTADQGTIAITACGSVTTTGTSFPVNGSPTGIYPNVITAICSPAAPSLPAGSGPLPTCNTPPVANDASATTNEDVSVVIALSGTDPDSDPLTFSIVSGPSHGVLTGYTPVNASSATIDYTGNLNFNGSDSFVYQANDGNGGSDTATVGITVLAVNDPPSFLAGPTAISLEDGGAQTYANWATSVGAGPADEAGQSVTFTVTNDNPSLFSLQPAVAPNGTLTYTAAPDGYGSAALTVVAQDNGGTANGGIDTSAAQSGSITITPVNDAPSFTAGGNVTVAEDSGAYSAAWASAISAGGNESGQSLTFSVSTDNNALFSVQPSISPAGVLTFAPAADQNGTATVSVSLSDNGGTANGGVDTSAVQTFTIAVTAVNDPPSFTGGGNVTVLEDSAAYSAAWATGISAGPADESGQTVAFTVSNDNSALFSSQPSISPSGVLTFALSANQFGSATVTVNLSDDGGGANTSPAQTFSIVATPVNDAPSFTGGGNVTVNEDSGAYSLPWASAITAGPFELAQTVAFTVTNNNASLFAAPPQITPAGVLNFVTAPNAYGSANVAVYLQDDGGTANGGVDTSPVVTSTITVNPVNDAPLAVNDSFQSIGNTLLQVAASQSVANPAVFVSGSVLANDSDVDSGSLTATLVPASVSPGAVVTMNPDGTFTYLPPAGASGSDTFSYQVSDGTASSTATVTITFVARVWYVNNLASGDGRSNSPFATLAAAQAASAANDTIFVFTGDGTTANQNAGFVIKNGQRLIGQGVALTVPVSVNGGPNPTVLLPAGAKPKITNTAGDAVTASGVTNVEVAGLEISGASNDGIALTSATGVKVDTVSVLSNLGDGISGSTVSGFSLSNSTVDGNGDDAALHEAGVVFANLTGVASVANTTIANSVEDNVRVVNSAGILDRITFTNVTVGSNHTVTGNDGLILQASGTATLKATVQNSTFTGARGDLFQFSVRDAAVTDLVFSGNALSNNHTNIAPGGGGVVIGGGSAGFNATLTYSITNNTFRDAVGSALSVGKGGVGTGNFTGTISNNVIGVAGVANSGSAQGSGIVVDVVGGGSHTATITNNQIHQFTNFGILLSAGSNSSGGGSGNLVAIVQGNVVDTPSPNAVSTFFPTSGIRLNSGTTTGDNARVCVTLGGAGALANSVTGSGTNGAADIRLFQRFLTTVGLPGYGGANNDNTAVANFVKVKNGTPTVIASNSVSTGGGGYVGVCP